MILGGNGDGTSTSLCMAGGSTFHFLSPLHSFSIRGNAASFDGHFAFISLILTTFGNKSFRIPMYPIQLHETNRPLNQVSLTYWVLTRYDNFPNLDLTIWNSVGPGLNLSHNNKYQHGPFDQCHTASLTGFFYTGTWRKELSLCTLQIPMFL